jgi:hypothetical protein
MESTLINAKNVRRLLAESKYQFISSVMDSEIYKRYGIEENETEVKIRYIDYSGSKINRIYIILQKDSDFEVYKSSNLKELEVNNSKVQISLDLREPCFHIYVNKL